MAAFQAGKLVIVQGDAENLKTLALLLNFAWLYLFIGPNNVWVFPAAGAAPRGPKIDENKLSTHKMKASFDDLTVGIGHGDIRSCRSPTFTGGRFNGRDGFVSSALECNAEPKSQQGYRLGLW